MCGSYGQEKVLWCFVSLVQRFILWFKDVCSEIQQMSSGHKSKNSTRPPFFKVQKEQVTLVDKIVDEYRTIMLISLFEVILSIKPARTHYYHL